ncbi:hypothetical protein IGI44_003765 [Enterococcus sp. DIV0756]
MVRRNTKEIILFTALELFADNGYEGVTMRDIAAGVGIMQSSLYKHYKSKQEIFDSLIEKMRSQFGNIVSSLGLPDKPVEEMAKEYGERGHAFLVELSISAFNFYSSDPHASQFRKMLSIERYSNEKINRIYLDLYIDSALTYQKALFTEMMRQGYIREGDPDIMALQFYSPVFLMLSKYDAGSVKDDKAIALLKEHVIQFDRTYRKE